MFWMVSNLSAISRNEGRLIKILRNVLPPSGLPVLWFRLFLNFRFRSCLELERDKQVNKQGQQTFFRSWVDGGEVAGDEVFEKSLP